MFYHPETFPVRAYTMAGCTCPALCALLGTWKPLSGLGQDMTAVTRPLKHPLTHVSKKPGDQERGDQLSFRGSFPMQASMDSALHPWSSPTPASSVWTLGMLTPPHLVLSMLWGPLHANLCGLVPVCLLLCEQREEAFWGWKHLELYSGL